MSAVQYMTIREVMMETGMTRQGVYAAIKTGRLPAPAPGKRDGKKALWERAAVMRAVENRTGHIRKYCEERGANPLIVGCDEALLGIVPVNGDPVTLYDHAMLVECLRKRGMENAEQWVMNQTLTMQEQFFVLQRPGATVPDIIAPERTTIVEHVPGVDDEDDADVEGGAEPGPEAEGDDDTE